MVCTLGADVDQHRDEFFVWLYDVQGRNYKNWFGYISNRPNRNAGMPLQLMNAKKLIPFWRSYALVSYSDLTTRMFEPERNALVGKEVEIFDNLVDAVLWTDRVIQKIRETEGPASLSLLRD